MTKLIIRLAHTRDQAFWHGLLKGLGAPALIFGDFYLDPEIADYEFKPLPPRARGSVAGDWAKVGKEIEAAVNRG